MVLTLTLPLPHGKLSPNARAHWRTLARHRALARNVAYWVTRETLQGLAAVPVFAGYRLTFYHGVRRNRDDDNASASCKAYRDGIAQALGVDDSTLRQVGPPALVVDRKRPRLEITLVQRQDNETDRRAYGFMATPAGRDAMAALISPKPTL